jgi:hypothetical protein
MAALRQGLCHVPTYVMIPDIVMSKKPPNLFVVPVGIPGMGKDGGNDVGRDAVCFLDSEGKQLDKFESPNIGSGEGLARLFRGYGDGEGLEREVVNMEVNDVATLESLAARKGQTVVGELLKAAMGQSLGFDNGQKATTTSIPKNSYRLCLSVGCQNENAGFFLNRAKDGLPQRFAAVPVIYPYLPEPKEDAEPEPVEPWKVTLPEFPRVGELDWIIPVPPAVRHEILRFHWLKNTGGEVDPLDGHLMLTRLKVAFGLAVLEGRDGITEEDWRIAGQLTDLSTQTWSWLKSETAHKSRRENMARAHSQSERQTIIGDLQLEERRKRVMGAIIRKLQRDGRATGKQLKQNCDSTIRKDAPAVIDSMVDQGELIITGKDDNGDFWYELPD